MVDFCKKSILALFCVCVLISLVFGQINETIVITTYFPSPTQAFKDFEVRESLAIGNDSESQITTLAPGQLYVGHSILLGNSTSFPASPLPGQVIYNSNIHKLQFYNGTWISVTGN